MLEGTGKTYFKREALERDLHRAIAPSTRSSFSFITVRNGNGKFTSVCAVYRSLGSGVFYKSLPLGGATLPREFCKEKLKKTILQFFFKLLRMEIPQLCYFIASSEKNKCKLFEGAPFLKSLLALLLLFFKNRVFIVFFKGGSRVLVV